jgi:hypothetical protein
MSVRVNQEIIQIVSQGAGNTRINQFALLEVVPISPCAVKDKGGNILGTYLDDFQLNIAPATQLYKNYIPAGQITTTESRSEGRTAVVLDFNTGDGLYSRDIETAFAWPIQSHLVLFVWQPSLIAQPETANNRPSDWIDGGTQGNKFIQGCVITADTGGAAKTYQLQSSDDLSVHPLNEMPAVFPKQTTKAFSCVQPFIAHSARVISTDGVSSKLYNTTLVAKPWPEQTMLWASEQTSFGMTGWIHSRECNIAYAGGPVTVTLIPDVGQPYTVTLPSSGGPLVQTKQKVTVPAMKFKLLSVQVFSPTPFYLFQNDMELKVKQWGWAGPYQVLKVVGGPSDTGALV